MRASDRRVAACVLFAALVACGDTARPTLDAVPLGTWGGDDAGMIVRDDAAHVHVGCTLGDLPAPVALDGEGAFDVAGTYNVDAFPIDRGIRHPARFTGRTDGRTLRFTARLTDTGQTFSSGTLVFGREPRMRNCPICRR